MPTYASALPWGGAPLALFVLAFPSSSQTSEGFRPWIYTDDGWLAWDHHQYFEDNAFTERVLSLELASFSTQPAGVHPEVMHFNRAHTDPPEGMNAPAGTRRLIQGSVQERGIQCWVNYSQIPHSLGQYKPGQFFSITARAHEQLTNAGAPALPPLFLPSDLTFSATGGAFGRWGQQSDWVQIPPHVQVESQIGVDYAPDALYVTAGVVYAPEEFVSGDLGKAQDYESDRFFLRDDVTGTWVDHSNDLPPGVPEGHSSGVVFADLSGDGRMDLFIGKSGHEWGGAPNVLLLQGIDVWVDKSDTHLPKYANQGIVDSTADVAAGDLDLDGDLDLVVANRVPWDSSLPASRSDDYMLINRLRADFSNGFLLLDDDGSDSRSVAIGNLDGPADAASLPEIVIANAGDDAYSSALQLDSSDRLAIFNWYDPDLVGTGTHSGGGTTSTHAVNQVLDYMTSDEEARATAPLNRQVLLVDLLGPADGSGDYEPDGYLDLVLVNHRDALYSADPLDFSGDPALIEGSNVVILRNESDAAGDTTALVDSGSGITDPWIRAATFSNTILDGETAGEPLLDLFVACGNRFHGQLSYLWKNIGADNQSFQTPSPWDASFHNEQTYNLKPGVEHGYGLDFADLDADGILDGGSWARSYSYFVDGIGQTNSGHAPNWHFPWDDDLKNERGILRPQGMEDGVFADFDNDGWIDALLASQATGVGGESAVTAVVRNDAGVFDHQPVTYALTDQVGAPTGNDGIRDARIDLNGRTSYMRARIADRAVAGDLDNDGDVDAIVRLFQVNDPDPNDGVGGAGFIGRLDHPMYQGMPLDQFSAGFHFLLNVVDEAPAQPAQTWFRDEALTRMQTKSGEFSRSWNRKLGMDLLFDADGNGTLDYLSTVATTLKEGVDIQELAQARDLLFLNGYGNEPAGVLTEVGSEIALEVGVGGGGTLQYPVFPASPHDVIGACCCVNQFNEMAGSFFAAAGDIDLDGDIDVLVTHNEGGSGRATNYPSLMVNHPLVGSLTANEPLYFLDEWDARVEDYPVDSPIHLPSRPGIAQGVDFEAAAAQGTLCNHVVPGGYQDMDASWSGGFLDWDADGDLDLVLSVANDVPRFLENQGVDANGDGDFDDVGDDPPGTFLDVTRGMLTDADMNLWQRVTTDGNDFQVVDLDADGDLDFVVNPFRDEVALWRNMRTPTERPAVSEIWPRIGAIQGSTLRFEGVQLQDVDLVTFEFAGGATITLGGGNVVQQTPTSLEAILPDSGPVGPCRVRVRRTGATAPEDAWSTQYMGYTILDQDA